jgi:hypothetical protein
MDFVFLPWSLPILLSLLTIKNSEGVLSLGGASSANADSRKLTSRVAYDLNRCTLIGDGRYSMGHYHAEMCMAARWCAWAMCRISGMGMIVRCMLSAHMQPQPLHMSGSTGVSHNHHCCQPRPVSAYINEITSTLVYTPASMSKMSSKNCLVAFSIEAGVL